MSLLMLFFGIRKSTKWLSLQTLAVGFCIIIVNGEENDTVHTRNKVKRGTDSQPF